MPPTRSTPRSCRTRSSFTCAAERHVADLVEEEGAAVGLLEAAPVAPLVRAGEGALLVAEQLALEERLGQRGAVDRHEGAASRRGLA